MASYDPRHDHRKPAASETGDPLLLTPGPLTTSASVKQAMVHDWGSRDAEFLAINRMVLEKIVELAGGQGTHVTVPVQGSGTFAVEAMITSFVPKTGKLLVLINGAYGQRAKIAQIAGRAVAVARDAGGHAARSRASWRRCWRTTRPSPTSSPSIARPPRASSIRSPRSRRSWPRHGRRLLVDSMSAFGALEIDARQIRYDALAASSNKCLEGVPGLGFVVCRNEALAECKGNATTLVLDLFDQAESLRPHRPVPLHAAHPCHRGAGQGDRGARGRGRRGRPRQALPRQRQGADRRHARHGLPHPAARPPAGADHRHLPHADRSQVRLPALL